MHHHPHDLRGRIEFAAFLARTVGELLDQVLVRRAKEVRELEIVVEEHKLRIVEVFDQLLEVGIRRLALVLDYEVEIDVGEDALELGILVLQPGECLVQGSADIGLQVLERRALLAVLVDVSLRPASAGRNEERFAVGRAALQKLGEVLRREVLVLLLDFLALGIEDVRHALEEEHPEDVFLVLGGVHFAAKDVGGFVKEPFELAERDFLAIHRFRTGLPASDGVTEMLLFVERLRECASGGYSGFTIDTREIREPVHSLKWITVTFKKVLFGDPILTKTSD